MKNNLCWSLALAAALVVGGCNDEEGPTADIGNIDPSFVKSAVGANLTEIKLGRIADSISTTTDVKSFGQMMMTDHQEAMNELRSLASGKSISYTEVAFQTDSVMRSQFGTMTGVAFDTSYLSNQIQAHQNAIALFQWEIDNGRDQEIKSYATKYMPKLQEHLTKAQELKSSMTGK